ncbi:hypothetical protein B0H10DRAFT_1945216 [Mycena sp. CBHHK59/15]|nr:hypothetical protein B0H10DRAFT_1945216 [Mycena sp. CBHHK59/15]
MWLASVGRIVGMHWMQRDRPGRVTGVDQMGANRPLVQEQGRENGCAHSRVFSMCYVVNRAGCIHSSWGTSVGSGLCAVTFGSSLHMSNVASHKAFKPTPCMGAQLFMCDLKLRLLSSVEVEEHETLGEAIADQSELSLQLHMAFEMARVDNMDTGAAGGHLELGRRQAIQAWSDKMRPLKEN